MGVGAGVDGGGDEPQLRRDPALLGVPLDAGADNSARQDAAAVLEFAASAIVRLIVRGVLPVGSAAFDPTTRPNADVLAPERCAAAGPAMLATVHALTVAPTWRAAAHDLGVHHSNLQKRLATAQRILGWDLHAPAGVQRLHLALVLRRLHRNPR